MSLLSVSFSYSGEQKVPLQNFLRLQNLKPFVLPTLEFFLFIYSTFILNANVKKNS